MTARRGTLRSTLATLALALAAAAPAAPAAAACVEDATTLCLQEARFRLRLDWRNPYGPGAGAGRATRFTDDTGMFWFFHPDNLEITLKVLDGRRLNGAFWVFYGSLSTVELEVTVTDAELGWERRYRNPPFLQTAASDTDAFPEGRLAGDLLVVTAHPDDEVLMAPLLGVLCRERGARCRLLVVTRGERGPCRLPEGCHPDVATVRRAELETSAALLGLELVQWDLADGGTGGPDGVRARWEEAAGGAAALRGRIRAEAAAVGADHVVTFDPRHGTTCHPDHRAIGALVRDAFTAPGGPEVIYLATRVELAGGVALTPAVAFDPAAFAFDATHPAAPPVTDATAWGYLLGAAAAHPSQIPPATLDALAALSAAERRVHLLPAASADDDPRYSGLCGG